MYSPYDSFPPGDIVFEYNGVEMKVRDCPDLVTRQLMGYGHHNPYKRPVIEGDWPYTVDTCELAEFTQGWWDRNGTVLFCSGCGLDCT